VGLAVTLTFDHLSSNLISLSLSPTTLSCKFGKFGEVPASICKYIDNLSVYNYAWTDSPKTECLQRIIAGKGVKNSRNLHGKFVIVKSAPPGHEVLHPQAE